MIGTDIIFLALFTILEPIFLNLAPSRKKWRKLKLTENLLMMFFVVSMVRIQRPTFCPVCDKGLEGSKECLFYQLDSRLYYYGKLPAQDEQDHRAIFC